MKNGIWLVLAVVMTLTVGACGKKNSNGGGGGGGSGTIAAVPPTNSCVTNPGAYNPNSWQPYYGYGVAPYGYQGYRGTYYAGGGYAGGYYAGGVSYTFGWNDPNSPNYGVPVTGQSGEAGWGRNTYVPAQYYQPPTYPAQPYGGGQPGAGQVYNNGFCGCPAGTMPVCDNTRGMACVPSQHMQGVPYTSWHWNGSGFQYGGYGQLPQSNGCYHGVGQTCRVGSNECGYGQCQQTQWGSYLGVCVAR